MTLREFDHDYRLVRLVLYKTFIVPDDRISFSRSIE